MTFDEQQKNGTFRQCYRLYAFDIEMFALGWAQFNCQIHQNIMSSNECHSNISIFKNGQRINLNSHSRSRSKSKTFNNAWNELDNKIKIQYTCCSALSSRFFLFFIYICTHVFGVLIVFVLSPWCQSNVNAHFTCNNCFSSQIDGGREKKKHSTHTVVQKFKKFRPNAQNVKIFFAQSEMSAHLKWFES